MRHHRLADFEALSPDCILDAVEDALDVRLTGLAHPHRSYINRVYELQDAEGNRLIAKFYRPGRWTRDALMDEHAFVRACAAAEIPVIAPLPLADGGTLGLADNIYFAVYPKDWGRELEVRTDEDWRRLGRIMGRLHVVGAGEPAPNRIVMHPAASMRADVQFLRAGDHVDRAHRAEFEAMTEEILKLITPLFNGREQIRIHGDCHAANVLDRPDKGIMLIDFDDMAMGPPIQDLWMLLPGNAQETRRELDLIIEGYEEFREFDWFSIKLIEPLRAMRSYYFWAWLAKQLDDPSFRDHFPDWGSQNFWAREMPLLEAQLQDIRDTVG